MHAALDVSILRVFSAVDMWILWHKLLPPILDLKTWVVDKSRLEGIITNDLRLCLLLFWWSYQLLSVADSYQKIYMKEKASDEQHKNLIVIKLSATIKRQRMCPPDINTMKPGTTEATTPSTRGGSKLRHKVRTMESSTGYILSESCT